MANDANIKIKVENNAGDVRKQFDAAKIRILESWGREAERLVTQITPVSKAYGGNLWQSISHIVQAVENAVYVGSTARYAIYVEMGTGVFASGGRPTPWSYQGKDGKWYRTRGMKAKPYLKPGVMSGTSFYEQEARRIMEDK